MNNPKAILEPKVSTVYISCESLNRSRILNLWCRILCAGSKRQSGKWSEEEETAFYTALRGLIDVKPELCMPVLASRIATKDTEQASLRLNMIIDVSIVLTAPSSLPLSGYCAGHTLLQESYQADQQVLRTAAFIRYQQPCVCPQSNPQVL